MRLHFDGILETWVNNKHGVMFEPRASPAQDTNIWHFLNFFFLLHRVCAFARPHM